MLPAQTEGFEDRSEVGFKERSEDSNEGSSIMIGVHGAAHVAAQRMPSTKDGGNE